MIEKAVQFAEEKHRKQERRSGEPYIIHPIKVARIIRENKESHKINELISAAFLHDTLEDTDTNEKELKELFGDLVLSLVKELTNDEQEKEKLGKKEYLAEKMKNMSSWALVIKLADRLDNVSDINTTNPEFKKRYSEETEYILKEIESKRELSQTHKKLIKQIKEKIR
jgi:GTP pyrophosphokinase